MKKLDARHKEAVRLYLREFFELFFPKLARMPSIKYDLYYLQDYFREF